MDSASSPFIFPTVGFPNTFEEFLNDSAENEIDFDGVDPTNFPNITAAGLTSSSRKALTTFRFRVVPAFYLVLCAVGLVGNGVVISVLKSIMSRNAMKSVTDILVINLAVADFIFVGSLPFWATELFMRTSWVFGTVGCKLLSFITLLNLYGSVFFLVAMGIDRYLAVVYAVRARNYRTPRKAVYACIGIWAFASLIGMQALMWRQVEKGVYRTKCVWNVPDFFTKAYYAIRMIFGFFLPFVVIVYCYILIILKLHRRAAASRLTGSSLTNRQQKITRAILAVISLFVVCWLPNHIVTLISALTVNDGKTRRALALGTANLVSVCFAYANSSINPILYAFMKEEIRQEGTEMILRLFICCRRSRSNFPNTDSTPTTRHKKFSFWRSTHNTVMTVIPRNGRGGDQADEAKKEKKLGLKIDCPNVDGGKSVDSSLPSPAAETQLNGNRCRSPDKMCDYVEKMDLVVKLEDE